jgi:hypothetical protein
MFGERHAAAGNTLKPTRAAGGLPEVAVGFLTTFGE